MKLDGKRWYRILSNILLPHRGTCVILGCAMFFSVLALFWNGFDGFDNIIGSILVLGFVRPCVFYRERLGLPLCHVGGGIGDYLPLPQNGLEVVLILLLWFIAIVLAYSILNSASRIGGMLINRLRNISS
jgi:hypothetical protein